MLHARYLAWYVINQELAASERLLPRDFWGFECRWDASIPDLLSQAVAQVQEVRMRYGSAGCLTSKEESQLNKCQIAKWR